ncbi:MAG: serine dehydratase subunit alpha family protein [Bacillota bacterium]
MDWKPVIIDTLRKEVVPAIGCTEPVAVALACARARELAGETMIKKVEIYVSPNIYKNGLCVGIPHTNEVGLHIAAALGAVGGSSERDLRVLENIKEEDLQAARALIDQKKLTIGTKDTTEKVYVEVILMTENNQSKTIICERHNQFAYLEKNGEVLLELEKNTSSSKAEEDAIYDLRIRDIIETIEEIPFEALAFMLDGLEMNERIAKASLEQDMGMGVGITIYKNMKKGLLADDLINHAMMLTAAGADARMSGMTMPVMSSNGSGNNGLTAILPIVAYRNKVNVEDEQLARALAISHMINGYIKKHIGRLSALCGCGVAASTASSVAIAWLMGASKDQIDGVIKNMVANISGMICDGAKVGCALKLATAASTAVQSALLAVDDKIVPAKNGIVAETAEETIKNLGKLGMQGMESADRVILDIMRTMDCAV